MPTLITILIILVCVILSLVVLVQNSKGGGLVSGFSSQNQMMGVRKTTDFLEKATWTLAVALVVLSLASNYFSETTVVTQESKLLNEWSPNAGAPSGSTLENNTSQPE